MSVDSSGTLYVGNGNESNGSNFIIPLGGYVQTSNTTPTTLITLATSNDNVYTVEAFVAGATTSGTVGIGGIISATFLNNGGTVNLIGAVQGSVQENIIGSPTFTLLGSGSNIILQVTGVASTTINWFGKIKYITGSRSI